MWTTSLHSVCRSDQRTARSRLAVESLEQRTLLAADGVIFDLATDDTVQTPHHQTTDSRVVFPGDANRDGQFNQRDLVQLFLANKYLSGESANWNEGDWNGDNVFDQRDLIAALQIGKYSPQGDNAQGEGPPSEGNQSILTLLAAEEAARIAADMDLAESAAAEEAARIAADDALAGAIAAEETARIAADDALANAIAAEEAARIAADNALGASIGSSDAALQAQIDSLAEALSLANANIASLTLDLGLLDVMYVSESATVGDSTLVLKASCPDGYVATGGGATSIEDGDPFDFRPEPGGYSAAFREEGSHVLVVAACLRLPS